MASKSSRRKLSELEESLNRQLAEDALIHAREVELMRQKSISEYAEKKKRVRQKRKNVFN